MKKLIIALYVFCIIFSSCNKNDAINIPNPDHFYQQSFWGERLLYKATKFIQQCPITGSITYKNDTLIINQFLEVDLPIDTLSFERDAVFPFVIRFLKEVLLNEIKSNAVLLQGAILIKLYFYNSSQWGELEFLYPISVLYLYRNY